MSVLKTKFIQKILMWTKIEINVCIKRVGMSFMW